MLPAIVDPDRRFALLHVSKRAREAVHALWALDETLGQIVAGTRDLFVGQMRLTWWHEALTTLEPGARRGQPVLDALASTKTLNCTALARLVEGWEALLEPLPLIDDALLDHAVRRGATLFAQVATAVGGGQAPQQGEAWALADLAKRCSDVATADRAWALAQARAGPLPTGLARPLRILARLARADIERRGHADRTAWTMLKAMR